MIRLFETNSIRKTEELSGLWDFNIAGSDEPHRMPVPACWETFPGFENYRGGAVYRKKIYVANKTHLRLIFKGVSHTAKVYFDGEFIAEHYNAYTPFSAVIKNVGPGEHEIRVEADNSFGEHSALHMPNDYFTYGGLIRPVVIEHLPGAYIERIEFVPRKDAKEWIAGIKVFVNQLDDGLDLALSGAINGDKFDFTARDGVFAAEYTTADVKEWNPGDGSLYDLSVVLRDKGNAIDDLVERVGFREVAVVGEKILINGNEIFIKGFNRHEDHAAYGASLSFHAMAKDIALIKDLGANLIRTSHYPNDELFLDLCDEHGIMVWEENHARALSEDNMRNPNFDKQCHDCNDEMVKNHFNHPSIIIWGILNECAGDTEYGRACYERQIKQIKEMDSSRPVTFATHLKYRDISLNLADIISWNLYFGWYENIPSAEGVTKVLEWSDNNGGAGKPVIISEFGAGGIPGYRDRRRVKWSEERQSDIIAENLSSYLNHKRITGAIVWQFCDCQVTEEEWFPVRPRTKNNKGVVDEFRRPKLAYDVVKKLFDGKQ